MRKLYLAGAAACAVMMSARIAAAQTCSITTTAAIPPAQTCTVSSLHSLTIPSLLTLTMSGFTSGTAMTLVAPTTMADFSGGPSIQMATTGPSYTVQANRNWKVQINAAAASFTGPSAKPAGDLSWSTGGAYTPLTTTAVDLSSGTATAGSAPVGILYKTAYNFAADTPGSYSLSVIFTLVAP